MYTRTEQNQLKKDFAKNRVRRQFDLAREEKPTVTSSEPNMSIGTPASFAKAKLDAAPPSEQSAKPSVKSEAPQNKTNVKKPEDTAEKPASQTPDESPAPSSRDGGLSNTFVSALSNFVPMLIGGIFEGSEGAVAAGQGAQQMMDTMQKRDIDERQMAVAERNETNLKKFREDELNFKKDQAKKNNEVRREIAQLRLQGQQESLDLEKDATLNKENRKQLQEFTKAEEDAQKALKDLLIMQESFENYSKNSLGGTGPLATLGGMTQYASENTQNIEAIFREAGLKEMGRIFDGMARAIDSDAERKAFQAAQPSLTNDDEVNRNIINRRIEAAKSMLRKIQEKKQGLNPPSNNNDINILKQQIAAERARRQSGR